MIRLALALCLMVMAIAAQDAPALRVMSIAPSRVMPIAPSRVMPIAAQDAPALRVMPIAPSRVMSIAAQDAPALRVMSFNIRYPNRRDGINHWNLRKDLVSSTVRFHRVDLCGMQEVMGVQMGWMHERLKGYGQVATGRDGRAGGERCPLFWRKERLELKRWRTFWLSPTPDRPSRAWGAALRRICTWGEFVDRKTGKRFFAFNTHWDHRSGHAREESAKLLAKKVVEIAGDAPVLVLGDLNCTEASKPYANMLAGGLRDAKLESKHGHFGPNGTWQGFGGAIQDHGRIDFVFVRNDVEVVEHGVLSGAWEKARVASDHRPVVADVRIGVQRRITSLELHHGWKFRTDLKKVGIREKWFATDFDASKWEAAMAGEPWERSGHELNGVGWYRMSVVIPESWRGEKVQFSSWGIDDYYTLWLNGEEIRTVGKHGDSYWDRYSSIHLPNSVLRFGQRNVLAFRVTDYGVWGGLVGRPQRLTIDAVATTHDAKQFVLHKLLRRRKFAIESEETRVLRYPLRIPQLRGSSWLRWCIRDGRDDSGDKGMTVRLIDDSGRVLREDSVMAVKDAWFECKVASGRSLVLELADRDTSFEGKEPGNLGQVEVVLKYDRQ